MLHNTEALLKDRVEKEYLDTYAIIVGVDGKRETLFSPNANEDTLFDIASMGKVLVTSTLVLHAVGLGIMSLDDTLGKFFPFAPADKKDITVRQCLTHTSGMVNNVPILGSIAEVGAENIVRQILVLPMRFKPGTDCRYCCAGMWLLGFILEKVYGMPLEQAFVENVARPLGYTRSRFNIPVGEPNAARSYTRKDVGDYPCPWDDATVRKLGTSHGSGGQFFTAADIARFCEAVLAKNPALYPEYLFDLAETPVARHSDDRGEMRGLGWCITSEYFVETGKLLSHGSFGHRGWTGTRFYIDRKKNMFVITLSNATRFLNMRHDFRGDFNPCEGYPLVWDTYNAIYSDIF